MEFDGQLDPHRDSVGAAACRVESPAAHGLRRGAVEVGVPGGLLHDDIGNVPGRVDEDAQ